MMHRRASGEEHQCWTTVELWCRCASCVVVVVLLLVSFVVVRRATLRAAAGWLAGGWRLAAG